MVPVTMKIAVLLGWPLLAAMALGTSGSAVAQTTSLKFAAFGDIGKTAGSAAVANLTRSQNPKLILMLGHLCYGTLPIAEQVNANYSAEKAAGRLRPALGNHEYSDACGGGNDASGYREYFTLPNNERYYDFVEGPVHFFALNSYKEPDGMTADSEQARWLKSKLETSKSPWQVVFFHHPPYSSGWHQSSTNMRWPFEEWGVDAVLNGHDHGYERVLQDSNGDGVQLPYFVSGLGGASRREFGTIVPGSVIRYSSADGALFVTATSTWMRFEFRNTAGTLIDSYARAKLATAEPDSRFEFKTPPEVRGRPKRPGATKGKQRSRQGRDHR